MRSVISIPFELSLIHTQSWRNDASIRFLGVNSVVGLFLFIQVLPLNSLEFKQIARFCEKFALATTSASLADNVGTSKTQFCKLLLKST